MSLTAAGQKITRSTSGNVRRLVQPWQTKAFAYYDTVGEIKYAAQFYSKALSQITLFAGEYDDDGDLVETTNEAVIAQLNRIQDPGGGRTVLQATYGRLMFLAGEAYLMCTKDGPEDDAEEAWEMVSSAELRIQEGAYIRYSAPALNAETFREPDDDAFEPLANDTAVVYRLWNRHPLFSQLADSPMQAVLEVCEELVLLTKAVRGRIRSRLAGAGILFIDARVSPAPKRATPDEDPLADKFLEDLTEALTTPIEDEASASAVVPLIVRVPVPPNMSLADMVYHMRPVNPSDFYPETGLRKECIERLGIGLDMPPEVLLGFGTANHWTGWQIDEQTWKGHLQQVAQRLVDDLTSSFLRPTLKGDGVTDYRKYAIGFDASAVINHPDRTKDAKDLYDRRAIGKKALRDAAGFAEEDAMTKAELAESIGIQTRDSSLAWFGTPAPRGGSVEISPGVIESKSKPGDAPLAPGTADPGGPTTGAEVEAGPPAAGQPEPRTAAIQARNGEGAARIMGACEMALLRARELAGNRLVSLAKRDPETKGRLAKVRAIDVAFVLGETGAARVGAPSARELVAGAEPLVEECLTAWGIADADVRKRITDAVMTHAARTLFEESPRSPVQLERYVKGITR